MSFNSSAAALDDPLLFDDATVRSALRSPKRLRIEVLAGLAVALALIPEAISFSILAGVDPRVGSVRVVHDGGDDLDRRWSPGDDLGRDRRGRAGGRPGRQGVRPRLPDRDRAARRRRCRWCLSLAGAAKLMRFVPRSVMVGFVNALAIVIFTAQLPELIDVPSIVYPLVAIGLAILVFLPRLTTAVPAPLVVIVLLTIAAVVVRARHPERRRPGRAARAACRRCSSPTCRSPSTRCTIIAPYALAMALVGLLESLMTAKLVDDITDTHSDKTREGWGQGVANIVTGFFGGMGGCAMIGQTMINVKTSGARTRISTFAAGVFLLILVVGLGDTVARIPMAALVAVMIMVSVGTMDWHSIHPRTLRQMPYSATTIMLDHRRRHRHDPQPRHRRDPRRDRRDGLLRPPRRPLHRSRRRRPSRRATPASTPCAACCSSPRATTSSTSSTTPTTRRT